MVTQAVILAGGKGTRLMPLTKDIPKPMVSVAGQPFLRWQLRYLHGQGIRRVLLLVSHLGQVIESHFGAYPVAGLELTFAHEREPLGTGGALAAAASQLDEWFFLLNGDSFLPADLRAMAAHAEKGGWEACIAALSETALVPVPANLRLTGDEVSAYEKGAGPAKGFNAVDAGVYLLPRGLVSSGPGGRFDLETHWPALIAARRLGAFRVRERFFDIGTPERLKFFEEHVHDYF